MQLETFLGHGWTRIYTDGKAIPKGHPRLTKECLMPSALKPPLTPVFIRAHPCSSVAELDRYGIKSNQQMHMVANPADALRRAAQSGNGSAQILVQPGAPRRRNQRLTIFRGEDQMIQQAGVRGWHKTIWLASLPGCFACSIRLPVVSLRSTTGYKLGCLRHRKCFFIRVHPCSSVVKNS